MAFVEEFITQERLIKLAVLAGVILMFVLARLYFGKRARQGSDSFFRRTYEAVIQPVELLFAITVVYSTLAHANLAISDDVWLSKAFTLSMIGALSWLAVRVTQYLSDIVLKRYDLSASYNVYARTVHTRTRVIRRVLITLIVVIAIASALMAFEPIRALGVSLLASAGVAGLVIGLAAQKTLGNLFTGIQIAITQPVRIGDSVIVENEWGWIEEINLTYVVVKIWDLRRLVLPISYFVDQPFQNWTRHSPEIIGSVHLHLDYSMPVQPIREELERALDGNTLWNGNVKVVQVIDTTTTTMLVRVLVSAVDAPTAWDLRCDIREKLLTFIQEHYADKLPRLRTEFDGRALADTLETASGEKLPTPDRAFG